MKKDKLAYNLLDRGFRIKAWYLIAPNNGDAFIQLFYKRKKVNEMFYPAYKIWNIAAHFNDIVDTEIAKDEKERGYRINGDFNSK